jgi:predicted metalloprotease with PDZ domain
MQPIRYRIIPARPEAHIFEVSCTVARADPKGQRFALPAWIPGSYLVRDFARHIVSIRAAHGADGEGGPLGLTKLDKHTWRAAALDSGKPGPVTVTCEIYAWDLSVRGAHLDTSHAFFNGTSVFLRVLGQEGSPCEVEILPPPEGTGGGRYRKWRVATSLARKRAPLHGFGRYAAASYDELIDHPVEMGSFSQENFRAAGVSHEIVITGRHRADLPRLARDMKRICEHHIDFFGRPAPMDRYVFLVTALGEGYGGLEHRASTALMCSRNDLPHKGMKEPGESYRTFLGLVSHEYFHTWNVKRIKPAAFTPYNLDRENYTSLLWAFEGLTSYYDDLALVRSGLITPEQYLESLGRSITQLLRTPGREKQSLADSSFDAWTKYYRQDENSPNAIVSYYGKGSLVGLCLDLHIREATAGRKSLDDVMRALWKKHGRNGLEGGVPEDGVEKLAEAVTGLKLRRHLERWVHGTAELPLAEQLATHGVTLALRPAESDGDKGGRRSVKSALALAQRPVLGVRGVAAPGEYRLTHVLEQGAAQRAGLAAGDVIVAVDGIRVGRSGMDAALSGRKPGQTVQMHAFRRDELQAFEVELGAPVADTCVLSMDDADRQARRLRLRWLGKA